jgi:hypothetical protein
MTSYTKRKKYKEMEQTMENRAHRMNKSYMERFDRYTLIYRLYIQEISGQARDDTTKDIRDNNSMSPR